MATSGRAPTKRPGKIESFHLEGVISKLHMEDGLNAKEVSERLKEQGHDVSHATVCRWLKEQRENAAADANNIFSAHVAKELPKDLDAIEHMEAICLAWVNETGADRVQRLSEWKQVEQLIPEYARRLRDYANKDEKQRNAVVKQCILDVIAILNDDDKIIRQRQASIALANKLIETKLRNLGVIQQDEKGNIIIQKYDLNDGTPGGGPGSTSIPASRPDESGRRLLTVSGGKSS